MALLDNLVRISLAFVFFMGLLNVRLAIGVFFDGQILKDRDSSLPRFFNVNTWTAATLLLGLFAVLLYWMIHYSRWSLIAVDSHSEKGKITRERNHD